MNPIQFDLLQEHFVLKLLKFQHFALEMKLEKLEQQLMLVLEQQRLVLGSMLPLVQVQLLIVQLVRLIVHICTNSLITVVLKLKIGLERLWPKQEKVE